MKSMKTLSLLLAFLASTGAAFVSIVVAVLPVFQLVAALVAISIGLLTWYKYLKANHEKFKPQN